MECIYHTTITYYQHITYCYRDTCRVHEITRECLYVCNHCRASLRRCGQNHQIFDTEQKQVLSDILMEEEQNETVHGLLQSCRLLNQLGIILMFIGKHLRQQGVRMISKLQSTNRAFTIYYSSSFYPIGLNVTIFVIKLFPQQFYCTIYGAIELPWKQFNY